MSKYLLAKHSTLVKMVDELKEENLSFEDLCEDMMAEIYHQDRDAYKKFKIRYNLIIKRV